MRVRQGVVVVGVAWLFCASAWAQDLVTARFAEGVGICRDAMLARVQLSDLPAAQGLLIEAPPEVRATHPLGNAPHMWVFADRVNADLVLVELEPRSCNVYALNADAEVAFDLGAAALVASGFIEGETEQRRTGGIERNFRSADRNVRVELQTFGEGSATEPAASDVITMALFGRRR
jgi:hypothetical protein